MMYVSWHLIFQYQSEEQQAVLCLHRIRQGGIKDRTARINRLRGWLFEFGIIIPKDHYPLQNTMKAAAKSSSYKIMLLLDNRESM